MLKCSTLSGAAFLYTNYSVFAFFRFLKKDTVRIRVTTAATASAMGAANKMPLMPEPGSVRSKPADKKMASGVKHRMSRTSDATTACTDLPMDWKKTVVILTTPVTVTKDK